LPWQRLASLLRPLHTGVIVKTSALHLVPLVLAGSLSTLGCKQDKPAPTAPPDLPNEGCTHQLDDEGTFDRDWQCIASCSGEGDVVTGLVASHDRDGAFLLATTASGAIERVRREGRDVTRTPIADCALAGLRDPSLADDGTLVAGGVDGFCLLLPNEDAVVVAAASPGSIAQPTFISPDARTVVTVESAHLKVYALDGAIVAGVVDAADLGDIAATYRLQRLTSKDGALHGFVVGAGVARDFVVHADGTVTVTESGVSAAEGALTGLRQAGSHREALVVARLGGAASVVEARVDALLASNEGAVVEARVSDALEGLPVVGAQLAFDFRGLGAFIGSQGFVGLQDRVGAPWHAVPFAAPFVGVRGIARAGDGAAWAVNEAGDVVRYAPDALSARASGAPSQRVAALAPHPLGIAARGDHVVIVTADAAIEVTATEGVLAEASRTPFSAPLDSSARVVSFDDGASPVVIDGSRVASTTLPFEAEVAGAFIDGATHGFFAARQQGATIDVVRCVVDDTVTCDAPIARTLAASSGALWSLVVHGATITLAAEQGVVTGAVDGALAFVPTPLAEAGLAVTREGCVVVGGRDRVLGLHGGEVADAHDDRTGVALRHIVHVGENHFVAAGATGPLVAFQTIDQGGESCTAAPRLVVDAAAPRAPLPLGPTRAAGDLAAGAFLGTELVVAEGARLWRVALPCR
jgi:hypothetical protein